MIHIAPSILSADFARLGEQVAEVERAGADRIHVDVMDGHFVPNLSMGPAIVESLRPRTRLPLEIHLMVEKPDRFVDPFIQAGADSLIFHWEVMSDPRPLLELIRAKGKKAGLAINPDKPVEKLEPFLPLLDIALCMTVYPGFAGQPFLGESLPRIKALRSMIDRHNRSCELEVDGGIDSRTGPEAAAAGANVLVAASALFRHRSGAAAALAELKKLVHGPT